LQNPDEIKNILARRRPVNIFPPVFTGLFIFVVEVAARMEKTRLAMETGVQLNQLNPTPRQRTSSLANASRLLKREWLGVARRSGDGGNRSIPSLRETSS
jgi:hypothetical protein